MSSEFPLHNETMFREREREREREPVCSSVRACVRAWGLLDNGVCRSAQDDSSAKVAPKNPSQAQWPLSHSSPPTPPLSDDTPSQVVDIASRIERPTSVLSDHQQCKVIYNLSYYIWAWDERLNASHSGTAGDPSPGAVDNASLSVPQEVSSSGAAPMQRYVLCVAWGQSRCVRSETPSPVVAQWC